MLQAIARGGEPVTLFLLNEERIQRLKQTETFYCPMCQQKVHIKFGQKKIAHFAHQRQNSCSSTLGGGEGEYHRKGKIDLYYWLKQQQFDVEIEKFFTPINQRVDIYASKAGRTYAIEYQCATISYQSLIKRTLGFRSLNIIPIWILGGNRLNRKHTYALNLTKNDLHFIHQLPSNTLQLLYYCSTKKQFARFNQFILTGRKETFGPIQYLSLKSSTFEDFFRSVKHRRAYGQLWLAEKHRFRTQQPISPSVEERKWREWLYLKRQTPLTLSTLIHLPVYSQWQMKVPLWNWQSRLYFDFILKKHKVKFTIKEAHAFLKPYFTPINQFPLIQTPGDPILEYIDYFIRLGKIIKDSKGDYQLQAPLKTYRNLDEALEKDEQLLNNLKNKAYQVTISKR